MRQAQKPRRRVIGRVESTDPQVGVGEAGGHPKSFRVLPVEEGGRACPHGERDSRTSLRAVPNGDNPCVVGVVQFDTGGCRNAWPVAVVCDWKPSFAD
ncbi:hypothetical protein GCM10022384_64440 [Streptomyces marokkonensis]|uniref:Uncharacterized protein n=1 Tax=Streptomyces marokkonensis TaxID=324855 RepID=A0ABP7SDK0_9ACTN